MGIKVKNKQGNEFEIDLQLDIRLWKALNLVSVDLWLVVTHHRQGKHQKSYKLLKSVSREIREGSQWNKDKDALIAST
jgi:hypothetical protein